MKIKRAAVLVFFVCVLALLFTVGLLPSRNSRRIAPATPAQNAKNKLVGAPTTSETHVKSSGNSTLSDVFISVKTSGAYHAQRLPPIINTWFQLARDSTWFFSDTNDEPLNERAGGRLINTHCAAGHSRRALACKTALELDHFLESVRKWWCHFDDDNYVNVRSLEKLLRSHEPRLEWYLGKASVGVPVQLDSLKARHGQGDVLFKFATGGAGYCISRALALRMAPAAGGGRLSSVAERIRLPDDVAVGYIITHLLGGSLTEIPEFHSHLESMPALPRDTLDQQISFSYNGDNALHLEGYDSLRDATGFISIHCFLYPKEKICDET